MKKILIPIGITAAAAMGCIAALFLGKSSAHVPTAYIYQDGKELARFPLDGSAAGETFTVTGADGCENVIEITGKGVRMRSASCPDQLCVKMGWRSRPNAPIVCLPNKVVIDIKDAVEDADASLG